jgi:hypothetical protein
MLSSVFTSSFDDSKVPDLSAERTELDLSRGNSAVSSGTTTWTVQGYYHGK